MCYGLAEKYCLLRSEKMCMENEKERKYALYALPLTGENIAIAAKERFSRATPSPEPGYVLIYNQESAMPGATEITAEHAELLSPADARWLMDIGAALAAEEIEKHKPEVLKGLSESMESLEAELRKVKDEFKNRRE